MDIETIVLLILSTMLLVKVVYLTFFKPSSGRHKSSQVAYSRQRHD
ncbi:hypothetical protein LG368_11605 [Marinomonas sp. E8]|uniref:Uncharacterized protein n=1 Tax=Marinomonas algarum TaxID=2883105 RepID=A0A9X1INS2_9GAMM|nr:hypothetical protein [Marinomonas algarum]